jgi:glycerate-2-kinase
MEIAGVPIEVVLGGERVVDVEGSAKGGRSSGTSPRTNR